MRTKLNRRMARKGEVFSAQSPQGSFSQAPRAYALRIPRFWNPRGWFAIENYAEFSMAPSAQTPHGLFHYLDQGSGRGAPAQIQNYVEF